MPGIKTQSGGSYKRAHRARTAKQKKSAIQTSQTPSPSTPFHQSKSMTNRDSAIDNANTMRQGKAPESSIGGYLVKVSLGLRLGQAVRRRRIRQERKPRKSRARRMANVAVGQKTNSCLVGTMKRSLDA
jgi:hypothetical protein